jgi:hypothetical protein
MRRSPFLRIHATQLEMAELGIGKQPPAGEQRRADTGTEGEHDDGAGTTAAAAEAHLRDAGGIGVVQHQHRPAEGLRRQ